MPNSNEPYSRREQDVGIALKFAHLEGLIERLIESSERKDKELSEKIDRQEKKLEDNAKSMEDIVKMWESSQWLLSFIRGFIIIAGGLAALAVALNKLKGM